MTLSEQWLNCRNKSEKSKHKSDYVIARKKFDRQVQYAKRLYWFLALDSSKRGKACGIDAIPVDVLLNDTSVSYLHVLFNICFDSIVASFHPCGTSA